MDALLTAGAMPNHPKGCRCGVLRRSDTLQPRGPYGWSAVTAVALLLLSGCVTFEIGIETQAPPTATTVQGTSAPLQDPAATPPALEDSVLPLGTPIIAWNAYRLALLYEFDEGLVYDIAWSTNGRWLASATPVGVHMYDASHFGSGPYVMWAALDGQAWSVAISPDSTLLAGGLGNGTVGLGRIRPDGGVDPLPSLERFSAPIRSLSFSPDSRLLAAQASSETEIPVWIAEDGRIAYTIRGPGAFSLASAFSPEGDLIASTVGDPDGLSESIALWSVADGSLLRTLSGHSSWVMDVAFSPDGSLLATAANDSTVRIWRLSDGEVLNVLPHPTTADSVAFSPDGKLLATAASDSTIRVYRVQDGNLLTSFPGGANSPAGLSFSPDGSMLASPSWDGKVQIWSVDGRLIPPSEAVEPSPTPPPSVRTRLPDREEVHSVLSIWKSVPLADPLTFSDPGVPKEFSTQVGSTPMLTWPLYWCATDAATLEENLQFVWTEYQIDGIRVPSEDVLAFTSEGKVWTCRWWSVLLNDWRLGALTDLTAIFHISQDVNDGTGPYAQGIYPFTLHVKVVDIGDMPGLRPAFLYPLDGQTMDFGADWTFAVQPVAQAEGYLWGFFQNDEMVWENYRDEGILSGMEYTLALGSEARSRFEPGPLLVVVRASIGGAWTESATVNVDLRDR